MTKPKPPSSEQLEELMKFIAGSDWGDLFKDEEQPVTYMEVSMRWSVADHMYRETRDKRYLKTLVRCESLMTEIAKKRQEGKQLYLKPSELNKLLAP